MPLHIKAEPSEVAETAILVSEPEHSTAISKILKSPKLVNENRGYLTYTGLYNDKAVTVSAHGLGGPSTSIVIEELVQLGVKSMINIGTALSLSETLKPGDLLLPTAASYMPGGTIGEYVPQGYITLSATPSFELLLMAYDALNTAGVKPITGPVFSSDMNSLDADLIEELKRLKILAADMETATVFGLSLIRGIRAAGVLIIVGDAQRGPLLKKEEIVNKISNVASYLIAALSQP